MTECLGKIDIAKNFVDIYKDADSPNSDPVNAAFEIVGFLHKESLDKLSELYRVVTVEMRRFKVNSAAKALGLTYDKSKNDR